MGTCISVKKSQSQSRRADILITGLEGSGKSVIFFKITGHPHLNHPIPTIGTNSEVITHCDTNLSIYEMGDKEIQSFLTSSVLVRGLMFVVDGANKKELKEASIYFKSVINFLKVPLLVYLTKKDKIQLTSREVGQQLQLQKLKQESNIFYCNGHSGQGVEEGLNWLFSKFTLKP